MKELTEEEIKELTQTLSSEEIQALSPDDVVKRVLAFKGKQSLATFAKRINIDPGTLSKLINGRYPSTEYLVDTKLRGTLRTLMDISENEVINSLLRLKNVDRALTAVSAAFGQPRLRFIVVSGETATGKTSITQAIKEEYAGSAVCMTARESWCTYTNTCKNIAAAMGVEVQKKNKSIAEDAVIQSLKHKNIVLVIDEAHHLGAKSLSLLKHILNECPKVVIVVTCIPSLWSALQSKEFQSAAQLKSRCFNHIRLSRPEKFDNYRSEFKEDVEIFLKARIPSFKNWGNELKSKMINAVTNISLIQYSLVTVDIICTYAKGFANGGDITPDILNQAIAEAQKLTA